MTNNLVIMNEDTYSVLPEWDNVPDNAPLETVLGVV